ncbi:MAG TPA: sulfite exporter TauE/SafE family protein, partial [Gammaproteobacteria bacterium]|nr:sulfite exporter TauE/SafE family protein [Gammaproteobacteria bacterium]
RFESGSGEPEPDDANALPTALFGMGAAMALNPCMPLATVLLAAAATASWFSGGLLGLGFGLGAVVVPAVVFGLLVAHIGDQIRSHLARWERGLTRAAGAMLLVLGTTTAAGWVAP